MAILTTCTSTFVDLNEISIGDVAPSSPSENELWFNTEDNMVYKWDNALKQWIIVNDYTEDIKDAIGSIQVNSRNLLYDTAAAIDIVTNNTETKTVKLHELVNSIAYTKHIKGNTLTFAFDWEFIGTTPMGSFYIQTNGPQYTKLSNSIAVSNTNYYGTEKLTVNFTTTNTFNSTSIVCTHNNGTIRISHARLLFGDKDLGWTQAPEDLVSKFETIFDRTAKGIYMQASGNGQTSLVNVSNEEVKIKSNNINIEGYTTINQHFKILPSGDLEAVNAKLTGTLDAFNIEGATIKGSVITTGTNFSVDSAGILTAKNGNFTGSISASNITGSTFTSANEKFRVLENGTIEAIDGNFKGSINAGSTITGASIIGSTIRNANSSFMVSADGIITGASIKGGTIGIGNGSLYNAFSVDTDGNVAIKKGSISINDKFKVDSSGILTATSGSFSGDINASNITGSTFTSTNNNFKVLTDGTIEATNGNFTGNINSGSTITGATIKNATNTFSVSPNGIVTGASIKGGTIGIGNGTAYNAFTVDVAGNVDIKKGSININNNFLVDNLGSVTANDLKIKGGSLDIGNGNFVVNNEGKLTATGAVISGNVTIVSGSVPDSALSSTITTGAANGSSALNGVNAIESRGYQTSSQVQQTVDSFKLSFIQSGGHNLLKNTAFKNGQANWTPLRWDNNAGGTSYIEIVYPEYNEWTPGNRNSLCACIGGLQAGSSGMFLRCGFDSQSFKVNPNTTYTLNCLMAAHRIQSYTIEMLCYDSYGNRILDENHSLVVYDVKSGGRDRNNWNKIKHTWTTQSNAVTCNLRAYMNEWNGTYDSAYMWICEPIITEGNVDVLWTPNADEVYTGTTTIDSEGLKVNHSNINAYSQLSSNSFRINKNGKDVFKVDTNGLKILDSDIQVSHNDGSYTKISYGGFERYNGTTGKKYHYYIYNGTAVIKNWEYTVIPLPEEIRGKVTDYAVTATITKFQLESVDSNFQLALNSFTLDALASNINTLKRDAVTFIGVVTGIDVLSGYYTFGGTITINYTIIA